MKKTALSLCMFMLAVLLLIAPPASADTINLVLTNPVQAGSPGSLLSFDATVLAPLSNGATVYLNGDDFNVNITGPNPIDDSGFLFDFPLSLNPGDSFEGTLFTVALPPDLPIGIYNGFFTITGGADPSTLNTLATVDFQIDAVPEPGTWVLLITGLGILAAMTLNRRHMSQSSAA